MEISFQYIYEDAAGFINFDDYFKYIDSLIIENNSDLNNFSKDKERYQLTGKKTIHDSRIRSVSIKNLERQDATQRNVEILLVKQDNKSIIKLNYTNITKFYCNLNPENWIERPADLLLHEFFMIEKEKFSHSILFDRGVWIKTIFQYFNYYETN